MVERLVVGIVGIGGFAMMVLVIAVGWDLDSEGPGGRPG
jgi:hypothetical protein